MSFILPKVWMLLKHIPPKTTQTFTDLEKHGFNPRTLSKYLQIAQKSNLLIKQGQAYLLTELGILYSHLVRQLEELTSFLDILEKIPRREIHSFLQIHVPLLKRYYSNRLKGIVLFGSSATTAWRPDSDIDLFIVVQDWNMPTWERATELYKIRLATLDLIEDVFDLPVSYYPLDQVETGRFHAIYPDIQRNGIILWQEEDFMLRLFDSIREGLKQEDKIHITTPDGESLWIAQKIMSRDI